MLPAPVPKASVDEHCHLETGKHHVRTSGELGMKSVSEIGCPKCLPQKNLRARVPPLDSRHTQAALSRTHHISH
jgi:hypothetical protein